MKTTVPNALLHARDALFALDAVQASLQLGDFRPDLLDSVQALSRRLEREIENLSRQLEAEVRTEAQARKRASDLTGKGAGFDRKG
jgi:hypothetical protein